MIKRRSFYSFMMFLVAVLLWTVNAGAAEAKETRAVWVSFYEYEGAGLKNKPESTFRRNADKMFRNIRDNGCNTVYFHVRAFDDAIWKSDNFDFSTYMGDAEPDYDPLAILADAAESSARGLQGCRPGRLHNLTLRDNNHDGRAWKGQILLSHIIFCSFLFKL